MLVHHRAPHVHEERRAGAPEGAPSTCQGGTYEGDTVYVGPCANWWCGVHHRAPHVHVGRWGEGHLKVLRLPAGLRTGRRCGAYEGDTMQTGGVGYVKVSVFPRALSNR